MPKSARRIEQEDAGAYDLPFTPLLTLLNEKILSRLEDVGMDCVLIARPAARDLIVPPGMHITRKKLSGKKVAVKGPRPYANSSIVAARWVEEHQEITRSPSVTCVVGGHTDLRLGNYILHCDEGYLIFIPPEVPHPDGLRPHLEGESLAGGSCDILSFALRGEKVHCWMCHSRGELHIGPGPGESLFFLNDRPAQLLSMLSDEALNYQGPPRKVWESLLNSFLLTVQCEIEDGQFLSVKDESPENSRRSASFDPIAHAEHYIKTHLSQPLTLTSMARQVYMSRAQFAKRFHEQTGQTFIKYINSCRLEKAQKFLSETNWSLAEIAEFVGFQSTSYFHRFFRREVGISPMTFRRQHQPERQPERRPPSERGRKSFTDREDKG